VRVLVAKRSVSTTVGIHAAFWVTSSIFIGHLAGQRTRLVGAVDDSRPVAHGSYRIFDGEVEEKSVEWALRGYFGPRRARSALNQANPHSCMVARLALPETAAICRVREEVRFPVKVHPVLAFISRSAVRAWAGLWQTFMRRVLGGLLARGEGGEQVQAQQQEQGPRHGEALHTGVCGLVFINP